MQMSIFFRTYYAAHFRLPPFGAWSRNNHDSVLGALPQREHASVLDVGSGDGPLARVIAERHPSWDVLGIDIAEDRVTEARRKGGPDNLRFEHCDFRDAEGAYDLIISCGCWEFFGRSLGLERAQTLLRPGGTLIVNTLAPGPFGRFHARWYAIAYRRQMELQRPRELTAAFQELGWDARWEGVNRAENSYTLVARRPD